MVIINQGLRKTRSDVFLVKKVLLFIFIALFVIVMLPIIACFYSFPVADDYNFGVYTHMSIVNGTSFFAAIINGCIKIYNGWQGFIFCNIYPAFQPFVVSWLYFVGWISKKNWINIKINSRKSIVLLLFLFVFLFAAGCFQFGIKNINSVSIAKSLLSGECQEYHSKMMSRIELYNNPLSKDIYVEEIDNIPVFYMEESLSTDKDYWTNRSIAKYYGKNSVVLVEKE